MSRRFLVSMGTTLGLAAASAAGWWYWFAGPAPPLLADEGQVDPAVAAIIRDKARAVRWLARSAARWVALGEAYEANHVFDLAAVCYRRAVELDRSQARYWYRQAMTAHRLGALPDAVASMRRAAELQPDYAASHWRLGFWLLDAGDLDGAESAFRASIARDAADVAGWIGLARVLLLRQDFAAALETLNRPVVLESHAARYARHLLGLALRGLKRDDDARREFARGAAAKPRFTDPWEQQVGLYAQGYAAYSTAFDQLMAVGRRDDAIAVLETARTRWPDNVTLLNNLAAANLEAGRLDDCQSAVTAAMKLAPNHYVTHLNQAALHFARGRREEALTSVERAIEINPEPARAHETKGVILMASNRHAAAAEAFRRAVQADPRKARVHEWLGNCRMQLRQQDEAVASYRAAVAIDPALATAQASLVLALLALNRLDEAAAAAERAAESCADHSVFAAARAKLEQSLRVAASAAAPPKDSGHAGE